MTLTAVGWLLQQLPYKVVEHQPAELVKMLAEVSTLTVEIAIGPKMAVRVRDGARVLVELSANG